MKTICAWCPGFDPTDPANADATHGICQDCRDRLIFDTMKRIRAPRGESRGAGTSATMPERSDLKTKKSEPHD